MSIYEAIGMAWVIFSSALATVGILYLAFVGLRLTLENALEGKENDVTVKVKEMVKIAR